MLPSFRNRFASSEKLKSWTMKGTNLQCCSENGTKYKLGIAIDFTSTPPIVYHLVMVFLILPLLLMYFWIRMRRKGKGQNCSQFKNLIGS